MREVSKLVRGDPLLVCHLEEALEYLATPKCIENDAPEVKYATKSHFYMLHFYIPHFYIPSIYIPHFYITYFYMPYFYIPQCYIVLPLHLNCYINLTFKPSLNLLQTTRHTYTTQPYTLNPLTLNHKHIIHIQYNPTKPYCHPYTFLENI